MLVCLLVSLSCLLTFLIVSTLAIAILQVGAGQAGEGGEEIRLFQPMQVLSFVGTRRKAKLSATFKLTNSKAFCNMLILNYGIGKPLCHFFLRFSKIGPLNNEDFFADFWRRHI